MSSSQLRLLQHGLKVIDTLSKSTQCRLIIFHPGIGARRIEITEEHRVYHSSTLFFRASKSHTRRTASIGPGISYNSVDIDDDWDASSHTPIHNTPGTASTSNTNNELNTVPQLSTPTPSRSRSRSRPFFQRIPNPRRMSFDASQFRRMSLDEPDEAPSRHLNTHQLPPIPPYSPFTPPAMMSDFSHYLTAQGVNTNLIHSISNDRPPASPVPSLENSRHSPYSSFRGNYTLFLFSPHRC